MSLLDDESWNPELSTGLSPEPDTLMTAVRYELSDQYFTNRAPRGAW